jgi:hypothetical protein
MSARPTASRSPALWAILGLALVRLIIKRNAAHSGRVLGGAVSHAAPAKVDGPSDPALEPSLLVREEQGTQPTKELIEQDWKAFLKRDVGWFFGILYLLAMLQAAFFAYDQILNDSALETAAMNAISHQWQRLRSR